MDNPELLSRIEALESDLKKLHEMLMPLVLAQAKPSLAPKRDLSVERETVKNEIVKFVAFHSSTYTFTPMHLVTPKFGKISKKFNGVWALLEELRNEKRLDIYQRSNGKYVYLPTGEFEKLNPILQNKVLMTPEEFEEWQKGQILEAKAQKAAKEANKAPELQHEFVLRRKIELMQDGMDEFTAIDVAAEEVKIKFPKQKGDAAHG